MAFVSVKCHGVLRSAVVGKKALPLLLARPTRPDSGSQPGPQWVGADRGRSRRATQLISLNFGGYSKLKHYMEYCWNDEIRKSQCMFASASQKNKAHLIMSIVYCRLMGEVKKPCLLVLGY